MSKHTTPYQLTPTALYNPYDWHEYKTLFDTTLSNMLTIIEDALCFGFEFKVEDHKIYYREIDPLAID